MAKFPAATYRAKVTKWGLTQPEGKNHLVFNLTFRPQGIVDPEAPDDPTKDKPVLAYEERTLRRSLANAKLVNWLVADVHTLGFKGKDLNDLSPIIDNKPNPNAHDFGGVVFLVTCSESKPGKDGKVWEEWRIVRDQEPMIPASKEALDSAAAVVGDFFSEAISKRLAADEAEELRPEDIPF